MSLLDGLINNYHLDNSGRDSKSGNDLELSGGAVYSTTRKLGSHSLYFDGVDSGANQQTPNNLDPTGPFTLACWFRADAVQASSAFIMGLRVNLSGTDDNTLSIVRFSLATAKLAFTARNEAAVQEDITSTGNYKDDADHLLVIGRDTDNKLRLDIDAGADTAISTNALVGSWFSADDVLELGSYKFGALVPYKGYTDNPLTWNRWLSAPEISTLRNSGDGLVLYSSENTHIPTFKRRRRG